MKRFLKPLLHILIPLVLATAILWWMYRGFAWQEIREALSGGMSWTWMLLSFPFGIMAQVFRAMRWRQSLAPLGQRPRLHVCISAVFISYASSLVIPRVGEVLRCGVLRRYDGVSMGHGVGTVVTERVVDTLLVMALAFLTVLTQIPVFLTFFRRTGVSLEGFLAGFSLAGYAVTGVCALLFMLMAWWMTKRLGLFSRTRSVLVDLRGGLIAACKVRQPLLFLSYSVGIWVCYYYHFYLTYYCFASTASLGAISALVAFVVGTFAVLVPTPNGAGPWHFAVKTVLVLYGVGQAEAALFVLIVHTVQTLLVALLGLYAVGALAFTSRRRN